MDLSALLPLLKEFGFPVALCAVLLLAIRYQNKQLQKASAQLNAALASRITVLEGVASTQAAQIAALEADRLKRADEYARSLEHVATRYATAVREWHSWMDKAWTFLVSVLSQRPGNGEYQPHVAAPPAPPDPPRPPAAPPVTERTTGRA